VSPKPVRVVYTPAEIAQVLRVDEATIRREIQRGNLSAIRIGRQYRFTGSDLEGWLGKERYLKLFTPVEALLELIGSGGMEEDEATRRAEALVRRAREELGAPRPEGPAPSPAEVAKRRQQRRGKQQP
jgi:excisionase family DNA binding protein